MVAAVACGPGRAIHSPTSPNVQVDMHFEEVGGVEEFPSDEYKVGHLRCGVACAVSEVPRRCQGQDHRALAPSTPFVVVLTQGRANNMFRDMLRDMIQE